MSRTTDLPQLAGQIQELLDRAASRHIRSGLLGVQSEDGSIRICVAAGAAEPDDSYFIASISKLTSQAAAPARRPLGRSHSTTRERRSIMA